jgi:hypothetical protein
MISDRIERSRSDEKISKDILAVKVCNTEPSRSTIPFASDPCVDCPRWSQISSWAQPRTHGDDLRHCGRIRVSNVSSGESSGTSFLVISQLTSGSVKKLHRASAVLSHLKCTFVLVSGVCHPTDCHHCTHFRETDLQEKTCSQCVNSSNQHSLHVSTESVAGSSSNLSTEVITRFRERLLHMS